MTPGQAARAAYFGIDAWATITPEARARWEKVAQAAVTMALTAIASATTPL